MEFWNYILLCSFLGTIIEISETEKIIVCEQRNLQLDCGNGNNIYVCEANYGRLKPGSYDKCYSQSSDSNQNCRHSSSLQIVRDKCQGRSSCSFEVTNSLFSPDPCGGVRKYLEVNYTCTTGFQTPTSCDNIITEDVIITTQQQTTEGTTTTKTTLPQTTHDGTMIQTSEQTTKDTTIEDISTTTESTTLEQTTEYETTSMGPETTTSTTKDTSTDDTTQVDAAKPKNHRQVLFTQNILYNDMVDEAPLFMLMGVTRRECASQCLSNRCTFFYFHVFEWMCYIYARGAFVNLNHSAGWEYFTLEAICPPSYTFRQSTYSCLNLNLPNSNYTTYNETLVKCAEHGGSLARIDTAKKHIAIKDYLEEFGPFPYLVYVLVQGRRLVANGPFVYDDLTELTYRNWGNQQPGPGLYLALDVHHYKLHSRDENEIHNAFFLCEVEI